MPRELELRVQRNGRVLWILRYAILISYVLYGLHGNTIHKGTPIQSLFLGIIAGVALIQVRYLAIKVWPGLDFQNAAHPMTTGPTGVWAVIIVLGGCAEELWRAFCLGALHRTGSSVGFAILCTSVVFAISELAGRPSRISSQPEEIYFTTLVGACMAGLFVTFHSLTMIICANIVYHGLAFYRLRRLTIPHSANLPQKILEEDEPNL